jgi:TonB family protein
MSRPALPVLLVAFLLAFPAASKAQEPAADQNTGGQQMETTDPSAAPAVSGSSNALKPIVVDPGAPAAPVAPPVAYESATFPQDRAQAWEMLVAATGLHGVTAPFHVKAYYKIYDAEGKVGQDGVYDHTWLNRNHWGARWTEGGSPIWQRWKTDKGIFAPPGQTSFNRYPESLVTKEIFEPLHDTSTPLYLDDENFSSMTLSCFRDHPRVVGWGSVPQPSSRFCTVKGRPILRFVDSDYYVYFNKNAVFQHHIVAQMINVRDDDKPVVDIDIEELRTPTQQEAADLQPPASAELAKDTTVFLPGSIVRGHIVKKQEPTYPSAMKQARVQGKVRLSVELDAEGNVHVLDVLSSPDPALTRSAEDAVAKWQYSPFLKDGKPVSVRTMVVVTYTMGY